MNITSALLDWMFSTVWCFDVAVCHVFFCWNEPNLRSITVKIVTGNLLKKKKTFCQHSYILMYCNNCCYWCDSKWHLWLARHLPLSLICLILLFLANVVQHLSSTLSCDCQILKKGSCLCASDAGNGVPVEVTSLSWDSGFLTFPTIFTSFINLFHESWCHDVDPADSWLVPFVGSIKRSPLQSLPLRHLHW